MKLLLIMKKRKLNRQTMMYEIRVSGDHFNQVQSGRRSFVIVSDDRKEGYEIGDLLIVQKMSDNKKVGEPIKRYIKGFQKRGKGLMLGYIILGLTEFHENGTE